MVSVSHQLIGDHPPKVKMPRVIKKNRYAWKVIADPSGLFLGRLFKDCDLRHDGEFEDGTVFEHIDTQVRKKVTKSGILNLPKIVLRSAASPEPTIIIKADLPPLKSEDFTRWLRDWHANHNQESG